MTTTTTTIPELKDAAKSDWHKAIATIAGGKAHLISVRTLLEDAELTQRANSWSTRMVTTTMRAGETLYYYTDCGTQRSAGGWQVYQNIYRPADEVTCAKCLKK